MSRPLDGLAAKIKKPGEENPRFVLQAKRGLRHLFQSHGDLELSFFDILLSLREFDSLHLKFRKISQGGPVVQRVWASS